jgi:hypothetical protein|tara:strand:+ start:3006 stop:3158 length:153 start_codon:yes stop_codon:yes gene_type:complete
MANKFGEKELLTKWPITSGLTANTKHKGRQRKLKYEKTTTVPQRNMKLLS